MKEMLRFYTLKIIEISFYSLFFLVPIVLSNNTSELFELNKMWLTWGLTIVVATSWIVKMLSVGRFEIRRTPLDIPILLFLFGQLLATIFSQDMHISLWGYYSRFNGGFYSTLSYVILYYAFVSNYKEISDLPTKNPFSLTARVSTLASAIVLLALSLPLAAPADAASPGLGFIFFSTLLLVLGMAIFILRGQFFNRLLLITLFSAFIVALWGIPSHYGTDATCYLFRGSFATDCWTESFQPTVRIFSTLGQPAWIAAYLSFLIPLTIALSLRSVRFLSSPFAVLKKSTPLIFFTLSMILYIALLFANTRGGFMGFWIGNAFFWLGFIFILSQKWKSAVKTLLLFNISFLLLTFVFGIPINQLQSFTLPELLAKNPIPNAYAQSETTDTQETQTETAPSQINITESGNIRLNVWQGAFDAWKANPILGTGVETFAFAYYKHKPPGQNLTSEWDFLYNKAHNEYLNYLATTGVIGLGTYLLLILWFFFTVAKTAHKNSWISSYQAYEEKPNVLGKRILVLALVGGYITILVSNFFGFSVVMVNLFFFLTPAFVYVLTNTLSNRSLSFPAKENVEKDEVSGLNLVIICVVILVSCYLLLTLYRYWDADKNYALGSNLNRINELLTARPYLQDAVKLRGNEPTFKDELAINSAAIGAAYLQQNDPQTAQTYINEAESLSTEVTNKHPNNVVFWKNRVRMLALLGQVNPEYFAPALTAIIKANELAPGDAKILYNYGVILGQSGRSEEGIARLEESIRLKPDYRDAYFALALFYRDLATGGTERVSDPAMQQKAEDALNFILLRINPEDKQAKETLESWN